MAKHLNAKRTAIRFFDAWKHEDWPICLSYVQVTWKRDADARDSGFLNRVKNFFGQGRENLSALELLTRRLEEHGIAGIRRVETMDPPGLNSNVVQDAIAEVTFDNGHTGKIKVRLICESSPYKADPDGTWGVNPNSISPA